jgi:hypothetical protein
MGEWEEGRGRSRPWGRGRPQVQRATVQRGQPAQWRSSMADQLNGFRSSTA